PFRSARVDALRPRGVDVPALWRTLVQRRRGALVGPTGSGKTTLLEALARHAQSQGWSAVFARADEPLPPLPSGPNSFVALDSLECLGPPRWWAVQLRLRGVSVVAGTVHRPGRLPTVWTTAPTLELVHQLLADLGTAPPEPLVADLFTRHEGDVRQVLRSLYDLAADAPLPSSLG
ncbi:MAG: hypothetical protein ACI9K2_007317, partial [Myxococcota bacterium]